VRLSIFILIFLNSLLCISQEIVSPIDKIVPDIGFDNIYVKKISTDSASSTFAIWIKQKVRIHKHINHTENVLIDKGYGEFQISDSIYKVSKGDLIVIPKNTWHGVIVNSSTTMKVISVQSPEYFGNDRVFKD